MAIDNVVTSLLRVSILAGLTPLQILEVARLAEHCGFRRGQLITRAGVQGDAAYLILSGEAVHRPGPGARTAPERIEPGSLVGELAMLVEHVYGATVVADGRVHCLRLTRAALHAQMREDPDVAERLARAIRDRLTRIARELRSIDQLLLECGGLAPVGMHPRPRLPDMREWARK